MWLTDTLMCDYKDEMMKQIMLIVVDGVCVVNRHINGRLEIDRDV